MNNSYKSVDAFLPSNFTPQNLTGYNKRWHEKYLWFVHSINYKQLTTKNDFNNYVNLSSTILRKYIGHDYFTKVRATLINNGVIEFNKTYSAQSFSQSYRLTEKYRNAEGKFIEIEKQTYCRKIALFNKEYLAEMLKDSLIQKEFRSLTGVRIKLNEALNYIAENKAYTTRQREGRKLQVFEVNKLQNTRTEGGSVNMAFTFKKDRAGRFHTPLTNLASDLRQFIYFIDAPEEQIVSYDFSNSQILFFISKHLTKKVDNIGEGTIKGKVYKQRATDVRRTPSKPLTGLQLPTPYVIGNKSSTELFKDLVFEGKIYDALIKATNWKYGRQKFKEYFFENLWYNSAGTKDKPRKSLNELELIFYRYFPEVFTILYNLKLSLGNREFCLGLQAEEARLFHRIFVKYIGINTPFFVVHDAIYVPQSKAYEISRLMEDGSLQHFGRFINIKSELCS
jgi:hypothetical protein